MKSKTQIKISYIQMIFIINVSLYMKQVENNILEYLPIDGRL